MKFQHTIDSEDVRQFCIQNNLYTRGNNEDYSKMLALANVDNCTPQRIINIAKNIAEHSDAQKAKIDLSLENIAYYLCENVMFTTIDIDD